MQGKITCSNIGIGSGSSKVLKMSSDQSDKFFYILKTLKDIRAPSLSQREIAYRLGMDEKYGDLLSYYCNTSPQDEVRNLALVARDRKILSWNAAQLAFQANSYRKSNDQAGGVQNFLASHMKNTLLSCPLLVSLGEGRFEDGDSLAVALHGARGCSFKRYLTAIGKNQSRDKAIEAIQEMAVRLAEFHFFTKRAHLDLHWSNVFVESDENLKPLRISLIDNHALALSACLSPIDLKRSFEMDRDRFFSKPMDKYVSDRQCIKVTNWAKTDYSQFESIFKQTYDERFEELESSREDIAAKRIQRFCQRAKKS